LLAISPSGHIRFAPAKQQIFLIEYIAEAKLRREPVRAMLRILFNSVYFVVTIPFPLPFVLFVTFVVKPSSLPLHPS